MKETLQEQLARLTQSGQLTASKTNQPSSNQESAPKSEHQERIKSSPYEALVLELDALRAENQTLTEQINSHEQDSDIKLNKALEQLDEAMSRVQSLEKANESLVAENSQLKNTVERLPNESTVLRWQERAAQVDELSKEIRQTAERLDDEKRQLVADRSAFERELERLDELDAEFAKLAIEKQKLVSSQEGLQRALAASDKIERAQAIERSRLEKLSVELHDIQARLGYLKGVEQSLKALEEDYAKQLLLNKRNKTRIRNLTSEKDQAIQDLSETQAELKVSSRELKDALDQLAAIPDAELIIRSFETVQWLVGLYDVDCDLTVPKEVLSIGDGPWPMGSFTELLRDVGFDVWENGYNVDVEVLIIGRDNWSEADLNHQIEARDGKPLRVYSQELFVLLLAMREDPLEWVEPAALRAFVQGHPAFEYLLDQEFPWPETTYEDGPPATIGDGFDGEDASSPLYKMGYSVAQQVALSRSERHQYLEETYYEENLPWCISDAYMEDWGEPNSRKRLRRIAWHLHLMTKRLNRYEEAVARWTSDLDWLKQTYYKPIHRFRWPS